MAKTVVVLGARNLGGAIIDQFLELGWNAAGVARSDDTLGRVRQKGALAIGAELREEGIHAALLAVDATIESPKTSEFTREVPRDVLGDMSQIAAAVSFLVRQESRALSHELVVTPAGERWVP